MTLTLIIIIIIIDNFCIALFSGVPKLTALYILQHFLSFTNTIHIIMTTNNVSYTSTCAIWQAAIYKENESVYYYLSLIPSLPVLLLLLLLLLLPPPTPPPPPPPPPPLLQCCLRPQRPYGLLRMGLWVPCDWLFILTLSLPLWRMTSMADTFPIYLCHVVWYADWVPILCTSPRGANVLKLMLLVG